MNEVEKGQEAQYDAVYKIVIVGDTGVGKTNLLLRFTKGEFKLDSKATIGVEYAVKEVEIEDQIVRAQFWDTAGQERFRALTSLYYRGAKAVIIVYDVTRAQTFENVDKWIEEVHKHLPGGDTVLMLLGNKSDLHNLRDVAEEAASIKAEELGIPYLETSALEGSNVEAAFESIIDVVYHFSQEGGASKIMLEGAEEEVNN